MRGSSQRQRTPAWQVWVALLIVYLVWGSTYLAMRVMVQTIPPLIGAGVRFLLAGALLYPALLARRGWTRVRVTPRQLGASALVGLLFLGGGTGLVTVAERDIPSGLAAVLVASMPLLVVLLRWLARESIPRATALGVTLGFAGVAVLLLPGNPPPGASALGLSLTLVAAVSLAAGSFLSSRLPLPDDALVSTALELLAAGVVVTAAGLLTGEVDGLRADRVSGGSLAALGYLIVAGSLLAYPAYVWLLAHAPVSRAATYTYVNPVVAIVLGWLVLDERLTVATLVGTALVVGSVAMVGRGEPRSAADESNSTPPGQGRHPSRAGSGERSARPREIEWLTAPVPWVARTE